MVKGFRYIVFILVLVSCTEQPEEGLITKTSSNTGLVCQKDDALTIKAIYGADNRLDWFESPGQTKDYWAKATLALIPTNALSSKDGRVLISGTSYENSAGLCPGNRFAEQPTAAFCSGFLVSEDLVVTAGHCIRDFNDCKRTNFIFDFAKTSENQEEYWVSQSSVYQCGEIVTQRTGAEDYALIRLNRKVVDRVPLNVRRGGRLSPGEQVMLVGHPMGMPSKISDGGFVQSAGDRIIASVDAFAANSGSVIFNSRTGLVEGILVAGEADFKYKNGCRVEAVCGANCSGEVITPISKLIDKIPDVSYENPICH